MIGRGRGEFRVSEVSCRLTHMPDAELADDPQRSDSLPLRVLEVLNEFDLEGLHPGEPDWAPIDEYWFEAQSLADLLKENGSISIPDLRAVWMHWFSNDASHLSVAEIDRLVARLNGCAVVETDSL